MRLAVLRRGSALLRAWDYDAPGLDPRARLQRLRYALIQACHPCNRPDREAELLFALADCDALLGIPDLEDGGTDAAIVGQRIARIRRVALHYEGTLARLNRRYWWIPFSLAASLLVSQQFPGLLALLEQLPPVW